MVLLVVGLLFNTLRLPNRQLAAVPLASALEAQPFPARLDGSLSGMLAYLASVVPSGKRVVFAN